MTIVKTLENTDGKHRIIFKCPGCKDCHQLVIHQLPPNETHPSWEYNGDPDKPTFKPSIMSWYDRGPKTEKQICHSLVTDGRIEFLGDCTHALKGQTVDLPQWPHAPGTFGGIIE